MTQQHETTMMQQHGKRIQMNLKGSSWNCSVENNDGVYDVILNEAMNLYSFVLYFLVPLWTKRERWSSRVSRGVIKGSRGGYTTPMYQDHIFYDFSCSAGALFELRLDALGDVTCLSPFTSSVSVYSEPFHNDPPLWVSTNAICRNFCSRMDPFLKGMFQIFFAI